MPDAQAVPPALAAAIPTAAAMLSFAAIRLFAGALMLALVMRGRARPGGLAGGNWRAAAMLFAYVACFSFAYLTLPAGTGALILFGAVQLTMLAGAFAGGERLPPAGWIGLAVALAGLVVLLLPGIAAPSLAGTVLMVLAGAAWGAYSLLGRGVPDPLAATAANFARAAPLGIVLAALFVARAHVSLSGILLAVVSGAITSGLGYVAWFAALRRLAGMQAAVVQLSVPVLAAAGGVLLLGEAFTLRLALAALAILGGIALVVAGRR